MDYWKQYTDDFNLGVDFERPDQIKLAGRLLIAGGHANVFFAVASALQVAEKEGIGEVKVVLPESLSTKIPKDERMVFLPSDKSGGFGKGGQGLLKREIGSVDAILFVGDMGKNTETITFVNDFLTDCDSDKEVMLVRDAVDLALAGDDIEQWLEKDGVTLFLSIAQMKKLLKKLFYPKVINLTMPLMQVVEILHKFTLSYSSALVLYHDGFILFAKDGEVRSIKIDQTKYNPMNIYNGELAVKMLKMRLWNIEQNKLNCLLAGVLV